MDGSDPHTIVSGSTYLMGIAVDLSSSRIYWADYSNQRIQSCGPNGENVRTIAQVSGRPWGIAVVAERVYWSLYDEKRIESGASSGGDVRSNSNNGTSAIINLAVADWTLVTRNRANPCCEGWSTCSGVCVLTQGEGYGCIA